MSGTVYRSKREKEKAIHHFETALALASPSSWYDELFWIHHSLAKLFLNERMFNDANAHIKQAKSHTIDGAYNMGRAMELQATLWTLQGRFEDGKSEFLRALDVYQKLGAVSSVDDCRGHLQIVEKLMGSRGAGTGELLSPVDTPFSSCSALSMTHTNDPSD